MMRSTHPALVVAAFGPTHVVAAGSTPLLALAVTALLMFGLGVAVSLQFPGWRARIQARRDGARTREQYDFGPTLQRFSQELATLREQEDVVNLLLDGLVETLNLSGIAFVALPEGLDGRLLRLIEEDDLRVRRDFATPEGRMQVLNGLAHLDLAARQLSWEEPLLLDPWAGCAALSLVGPATSVEGLALLVIGKKRSGSPLQRDDQALLVTLAHQAATALANALLVAGLKTSLAQVQISTEQLVAARAEQQLLLRELVSADERQRAALARDLHDDALQEALYLIRHSRLCSDLAEHLEDSPVASNLTPGSGRGSQATFTVTRLQQELEHLCARSIVVEHKLRELCLGLYPALLPSLGLPAALEDLAKELSASLGVRIEVDVDDTAIDAAACLPSEVSLHLYRIVQEALRNAGKHGRAERASVSLRVPRVSTEHKTGRYPSERGILELRITDSGQGLALPIDYAALLRQGHLGLAGMRERAERIGGTLEITARSAEGTSVTVRTPLEDSRYGS